ncbi:MAG: ROK family protein [Thermomicrobiales bacterium]
MTRGGVAVAKRYAVGIDYGGTKLLAAVVDLKTGEVVATAKKRTSASDSPKAILERMEAVTDAALESAKLKPKQIEGIGVGAAGQVDSKEGVLLGTPNLSQAVVNLPIVDSMKKRYGVPVALRNDVQVAATGELAFGAGKGVKDFLCCFVGTGIGGAIVVGGSLVLGASGSAGEIGHVVVDSGGRVCGCGGRGHLEAYASRTGMTLSLMGDLKRGRPSVLRELAPELSTAAMWPESGAVRSGVLQAALEAGDRLVEDTITDAGRFLGIGLASAINLLNPARIILGGGVIEAVGLLYDVAVDYAEREALAAPGRVVEFRKAGLGDHAGVVGAALIGAGG